MIAELIHQLDASPIGDGTADVLLLVPAENVSATTDAPHVN